jgi:hypothetical protein
MNTVSIDKILVVCESIKEAMEAEAKWTIHVDSRLTRPLIEDIVRGMTKRRKLYYFDLKTKYQIYKKGEKYHEKRDLKFILDLLGLTIVVD